MKKSPFLQSLDELEILIEESRELEGVVSEASNLIAKRLKAGNKLMICGNGGSAADAQHMAAELVNRFLKERSPLAAIALTTDTSNLTSIANDYSFELVFAKQVEALGKEGDVLFGISTSGNSSNVLEAFRVAKEKGIFCIGLLGRDGGAIANLSDIRIVIPSFSTPRIQELHTVVIHSICEAIEEMLF